MTKLAIKLEKMLLVLALVITAMNVNYVCMLFAHQPELPEEAKKLHCKGLRQKKIYFF